jgi:hypothetical protein
MNLFYAVSTAEAPSMCAAAGVVLTTPFAGFYHPRSAVCLFLGDASLGLLRSVLVGLASCAHFTDGRVPAHGALAADPRHGVGVR